MKNTFSLVVCTNLLKIQIKPKTKRRKSTCLDPITLSDSSPDITRTQPETDLMSPPPQPLLFQQALFVPEEPKSRLLMQEKLHASGLTSLTLLLMCLVSAEDQLAKKKRKRWLTFHFDIFNFVPNLSRLQRLLKFYNITELLKSFIYFTNKMYERYYLFENSLMG